MDPHPRSERMEEDEGVALSLEITGGPDDAESLPDPNYYQNVAYPPLNCMPWGDSALEWNYFARRTCQEIIPGLHLGPYASATKSQRDAMTQMGLTHVVCIRSPAEVVFIRPNHPDLFQYLVLDVNDSVYEGIIPNLKKMITFLDECLNKGGRALVHGNAGMCRSAAMVVGYVMWRHGVTAENAFRYVQNKRFCIQLNDGFMHQLRDFEAMVQAIHMVPPTTEPRNKRSAEDDEDHPAEKHGVTFNGGANNNQ